MKRIFSALFFISNSRVRSGFRLLIFVCSAQFSFAQNPLVKQWDYRFGGIYYDQLTCFEKTVDGGCILGGYTNSGIGGEKSGACKGDFDYWIVKTDSLGIKQWDKDFGGLYSDDLFSLQQTADDGYILGGRSTSPLSGDKSQALKGGQDYWIIKINSFGIKQWDKDFGGTLDNQLYSIQQTSDGGYILGGNSTSGIGADKTEALKGNWDYWIVKTDSSGIKQWDRDFGGTDADWLTSILQTSDGGYLLGGYSNSGIGGDKSGPSKGLADYWIIKIDSLGIKEWDRDLGGWGDDFLYSMQQTSDGGFILAGVSHSSISVDKSQAVWGGDDYWIVKVDALGIKQWDKDFGGFGDEDYFGNISQTADKGYLIAGTSTSQISGDKTEDNLGTQQAWIIKTDSLGIKQWDKTILTTGANGYDRIGFAAQTKDGCYAIANYTLADTGGYKTQPHLGGPDYWMVKFCDTTLKQLSFVAAENTLCEKFCTNFTDQSNNNSSSWQWLFPGGDPSSSSNQNPTSICYNTPGTYDVTLISTNASGSHTLTLHNYITVYSTPPFPTITQIGDTIISSASNFYQWQLNSLDIPGATNQSYTILQSGLYTVVVGDSTSCKNSFTEYVLISGVDDVMGDGNISISPNPSNGNFTVEFTGQTDNVSIDIVNTVGQIIFSSAESRSIGNSRFKKEIDLRNDAMHCVATGVYIVEIKTKDVLLRKKIMIEE